MLLLLPSLNASRFDIGKCLTDLLCSALFVFKTEVESWWQVVYSPFAGDLLATEHFLGILAMEKAASGFPYC